MKKTQEEVETAHTTTNTNTNTSTSNKSVCHEKGSVRHLEKRRNGTCTFANRIAQVSLDCYHQQVVQPSSSLMTTTTCVSTIVAYDTNTDTFTVVSLGVGTKFCQSTTIHNDNTNKELYGTQIRDGHAEVLAKRSFQKYLITEVTHHHHHHENESNHSSMNDDFFILEPLPNNNEIQSPLYRIKSNITIHMYCSSVPCGNASWKKFAKLHNCKEIFQTNLPSNSWPKHQLPHLPLQAHSLQLGQFALLLKKNNHISSNELLSSSSSFVLSPYLHPKQKEWTCFQINNEEDWCPPGTSIWKGSSHTCSDKICRWNILGVQGSLLSSLLKEPIYLTTITIGRKYNFEMCRRALCCRAVPPKKKKKKQHPQNNNASSVYQLHHPVLMETNVYMNSNNVIDMSSIQSIGQDVKFNTQESSYCYAWWKSSSSTTTRSSAERIDGISGYRVTNTSDNNNENEQQSNHISEVATISLQQQLYSLLFPTMKTNDKCNSLKEYTAWKEQVSPDYEQFKEHLLTKHPVFCQWKRRRYHFFNDNNK